MSRLNDDSASNVEKRTRTKWYFKTKTFVDWQHKVEIWAESHDIRHLLEHLPVADPAHMRKHEVAKRIIQLTLLNHDRAYVRGSLTLIEIWSKFLAKYMPSIDQRHEGCGENSVLYVRLAGQWLSMSMSA